jgi:hypothetical protein
MSDLAQLTGATLSSDDVLPGYVLSPWSISEIGEAEQEFEQNHIRLIANGAADATLSVQAQMSETAQNCLAAVTLVTDDNRRKLQEACRRCAGWKPLPNSQGATPTTADAPPSAQPPSPGDVSTSSSAAPAAA